METIRCNFCGYQIPSEAISCPHCGKNISKIKRKTILLLIFSLPMIFGLFSAFQDFHLGLWFTLGVITQAYFLSQYVFDKNMLKNFLACIVGASLLTSLLMIYIKTPSYYLSTALIFFCFIFSIMFHFIFRKEIIYKIDESLLIIWNLVFLYVYFSKFGFYNALTPIFIILAIINFVIIIFPNAPKLFLKVFLYCWFLFIIIFLSVYQLDFKIFTSFLTKSSFPGYNPLNTVLTGMIFLYVVSYSIFIIMLFVPFLTRYNLGTQYNLHERLEESKKHALMLSNEYEDKQISFPTIIFIIILVGGALTFNNYFKFIPDYTLVNIFLVASFYISNLGKSHQWLDLNSETVE